MKTAVLIDSNIIIDHLNGIDAATEYLDGLPVLRVSSMTVFEVLSGCTGAREPQEEQAEALFGICDVIELSEAAARRAAGYYRKNPVKKRIIDYLISATAETSALEVATRNPGAFKSVKAFEPYKLKRNPS